MIKVALLSLKNNKYVCAENDGMGPLIANRNKIGDWEKFILIETTENKFAIKSNTSLKFVCIENEENHSLFSNRDVIGPWDTYELKKNES